MATEIYQLCLLYLAIGAVFALWFAFLGVRRIDDAPGSLGFRLLILPASAALWPLLLKKTLIAPSAHGLPTVGSPHRHRVVHRWLWIALTVVIFVLLFGALR